MPLTSGILSVTSANANSISLSATAASGGTAPYTYQWYSSPGGTGFVANLSTIISGATGLSLTAVGLFASVTYGFQLISTDATGLTVFSTQLGASTTAIGEVVLGPNANSKSDSELSKFFLTAGGQTAVRVVNPDGTSIAGGGGGSTTVNAHAAPQSFVEGTNNPFQGDLQGALKVNVVAGSGGGGTSSTFGANLPTVGTATGFVDQNGKMQAASVAAFHAGDNTNVSAGGLGLLTGGVTQIKNAQGGLDRQTEAGLDNVSALGITTGIASFSVPFTFTVAAAITASTSSQVVTPSSMANIYVGTVLNFDTGTPTVTEPVIVVSFTATTFNGVFTKSHSAGVSAKAFYYNQARDGAIGDSVPVAGLSAGMTYFINSINGLAEQERSAAGELDGASGRGTAVAAEYEYNSGGPITSTGSVSGLNFDRARNIQGKGKNIQTLSAATTAGATAIVLTAAPSLTLLPGQQIVVGRATGTVEAAYVAFNYVPGTATVTVQTPLAQAHSATDTVEWDVFAPLGPGTSGFIATGMGIEEEALYDPASKQFFLAVGAGSDANAPTNTPIEVEGLYNGTTVDRARSVAAITDAYTGAGVGADAVMLYNGTTYDRARVATGDAFAITGVPAEAEMLWNGSGFDRAREATADALPITGVAAEAEMLWNGTTFDRAREVPAADGQAATGFGADSIMLWNGANYDRMKGTAGNANVTVTPAASATGWTPNKVLSTATTNATLIKAAPGNVGGWTLYNNSAGSRFVHFYNLTTAPTVGTNSPFFTIELPAGGGSNVITDAGMAFGTGISYSITAAAGDLDATIVAANDIVGTILSK